MNVIALIDCDSFFVSCEQKINPDLKNKPVCVLSNKDGCVISRSKEAKQMGIRMGQPYFMVKKEFPKGIYISCHHELYGEISNNVMSLLKTISPTVEVCSIDEAYVDLTGLKKLYKKNYIELAEFIRKKILDEVGIHVSIGVSSSKTLAKLASDKAKNSKNGIFVIGKRKINKILNSTAIEEVCGIGYRLTKLCKKNGILSAYDYVTKKDNWIDQYFGKNGLELKHELLGETISPVSSEIVLPKSIQKTSAFGLFTSDINFIKNQLNYHIHYACKKLRKINSKAKTIGVMLRTKDFRVHYNKIKIEKGLSFELEISDIAFKLLEQIYNENIIYRSTGIILEDFIKCSEEQLFLFSDANSENKIDKLTKCIDNLEERFGKNIVQIGFYHDKDKT